MASVSTSSSTLADGQTGSLEEGRVSSGTESTKPPPLLSQQSDLALMDRHQMHDPPNDDNSIEQAESNIASASSTVPRTTTEAANHSTSRSSNILGETGADNAILEAEPVIEFAQAVNPDDLNVDAVEDNRTPACYELVIAVLTFPFVIMAYAIAESGRYWKDDVLLFKQVPCDGDRDVLLTIHKYFLTGLNPLLLILRLVQLICFPFALIGLSVATIKKWKMRDADSWVLEYAAIGFVCTIFYPTFAIPAILGWMNTRLSIMLEGWKLKHCISLKVKPHCNHFWDFAMEGFIFVPELLLSAFAGLSLFYDQTLHERFQGTDHPPKKKFFFKHAFRGLSRVWLSPLALIGFWTIHTVSPCLANAFNKSWKFDDHAASKSSYWIYALEGFLLPFRIVLIPLVLLAKAFHTNMYGLEYTCDLEYWTLAWMFFSRLVFVPFCLLGRVNKAGGAWLIRTFPKTFKKGSKKNNASQHTSSSAGGDGGEQQGNVNTGNNTGKDKRSRDVFWSDTIKGVTLLVMIPFLPLFFLGVSYHFCDKTDPKQTFWTHASRGPLVLFALISLFHHAHLWDCFCPNNVARPNTITYWDHVLIGFTRPLFSLFALVGLGLDKLAKRVTGSFPGQFAKETGLLPEEQFYWNKVINGSVLAVGRLVCLPFMLLGYTLYFPWAGESHAKSFWVHASRGPLGLVALMSVVADLLYTGMTADVGPGQQQQQQHTLHNDDDLDVESQQTHTTTRATKAAHTYNEEVHIYWTHVWRCSSRFLFAWTFAPLGVVSDIIASFIRTKVVDWFAQENYGLDEFRFWEKTLSGILLLFRLPVLPVSIIGLLYRALDSSDTPRTYWVHVARGFGMPLLLLGFFSDRFAQVFESRFLSLKPRQQSTDDMRDHSKSKIGLHKSWAMLFQGLLFPFRLPLLFLFMASYVYDYIIPTKVVEETSAGEATNKRLRTYWEHVSLGPLCCLQLIAVLPCCLPYSYGYLHAIICDFLASKTGLESKSAMKLKVKGFWEGSLDGFKYILLTPLELVCLPFAFLALVRGPIDRFFCLAKNTHGPGSFYSFAGEGLLMLFVLPLFFVGNTVSFIYRRGYRPTLSSSADELFEFEPRLWSIASLGVYSLTRAIFFPTFCVSYVFMYDLRHGRASDYMWSEYFENSIKGLGYTIGSPIILPCACVGVLISKLDELRAISTDELDHSLLGLSLHTLTSGMRLGLWILNLLMEGGTIVLTAVVKALRFVWNGIVKAVDFVLKSISNAIASIF